jgi:hypothetical protein
VIAGSVNNRLKALNTKKASSPKLGLTLNLTLPPLKRVLHFNLLSAVLSETDILNNTILRDSSTHKISEIVQITPAYKNKQVIKTV